MHPSTSVQLQRSPSASLEVYSGNATLGGRIKKNCGQNAIAGKMHPWGAQRVGGRMIGPAAAHAQKYPIPTQPCLPPLPPASLLPAARRRNPPSTSAFRTFGPLPPGWRFIKVLTKHQPQGAAQSKTQYVPRYPIYAHVRLQETLIADRDTCFPALACCSRVLPS
jgi:hypothetical protein